MAGTSTIPMPVQSDDAARSALWRRARWLGIFTIVYNILEGVVSVALGASDDALALFGFGLDSFVETISAVGVLVMILRVQAGGEERRTTFEVTALRVTGWCFLVLAVALVAGAALSLVTGSMPETTLPGIVISSLSILSMVWLVHAKRTVGRALDSASIVADAQCNAVCVSMSVVLLASSGLFALTGLAFFDALGAAGLAWYSLREGREALEKARTGAVGCVCASHGGCDSTV
jgi:divalent metal cation (Fe/Co/Zn/Cd) transporter